MSNPMEASGTAYQRTAASRLSAPTNSTTTSEYMQIRWNQHILHGTRFCTSLKYRLPAIAEAATSHASHTAAPRSWASTGRAAGTQRAAIIATAPVPAMSASSAKNRCANNIVIILPSLPAVRCAPTIAVAQCS